MSEQKPDAAKLKREQRETWDANAAGWQKWFGTLERAAQVVSDRLVELAAVKPGHRVLDIATGTGEPAVTAARVVGASGRVVGVDQSPGMLRFARERAAALGFRNLEFVEADAESLQMLEHSFDAVLCRWGLMFMPDLESTLSRLRSLMKPGASLATSVWASADKVPLMSIGMEAVRKITGIAPPPPDALGPCRLADTSILDSALRATGFRDVTIEPITVTFEFESAEVATAYRSEIGNTRATFERFSEETRAKVREAMLAAARQYAGADGVVRLSNQAICFAARS
ncbi:MAG TPA: methyltransferase domain-containing protein [Candidatus Binataceae bacterium]